jgi:hypothetical protein
MTLTKSDLAQFTGTTVWYRHPLFKAFSYTDGVQYVASEGGAYWLIEKIFALQHYPKVRSEAFQLWTLQARKDQSATITCEDGNGGKVYAEELYFTDFPLSEIKLYFTDNVLLLPSEY